MRWSMLPVSIAAHAVLFTVLVVVPLASVDMPTPWALSSMREFIAAAPAPPPPEPVEISRAGARSDLAPVIQPDHIAPPHDEPPPTTGPDVPGAGHAPDVGMPPGLSLDTFAPTTIAIADPPAPPPQRTYRTGGAIREPRKIRDVPAVYPDVARAAKIEGLVILEATIDERGVVSDARVLRSIPLLDSAALTALKQWRYTPTLLNGVPVRVLMTVTFRFSLGDHDL